MESVMTLQGASEASKAVAHRHLIARTTKPLPVSLPLPPIQFDSAPDPVLAPYLFTFQCQTQKPQQFPPALYIYKGRTVQNVPRKRPGTQRYGLTFHFMSIDHKTIDIKNWEPDWKFPRPIYDVLELLETSRENADSNKTRGKKKAFNEAYWIQVR